MQNENKLDAQVNIPKFPINTTKYYVLDKNQDWVKDLLLELNEKADDKSADEYLNETSIEIKLELLKKFKPDSGEFLLLKGSVIAHYVTQCVRTLAPMNDSVDINLQACFIDSARESEDVYQDQTETFQENEMYDLYFYKKNQADIKEMIHEQIFLNINQYPIKDHDSELVWAKESSDKKQ